MYSQYGEDDIVAEILGSELNSVGRVLEIGAWDPVTFSNSRMLIQHNWKAVLIECSPGPLKNLAKAYADNPRVQIVAAAIVCEPAPRLIQMTMSDDGLSSSEQANVDKWREKGGFYGTLYVPTLTPKMLTDLFEGAHVVSIDTEGTSVDVTRQYLETGARPRALIVEHDNRAVELMDLAGPMHYSTRWANGTNMILELRPA